jgi:hypothetical protein
LLSLVYRFLTPTLGAFKAYQWCKGHFDLGLGF